MYKSLFIYLIINSSICCAASSCNSVCLGLVITFVLVLLIIAVIVIIVVMKRRRRPAKPSLGGPHVSNIVVSSTPGAYDYINPIDVNSNDSLPPSNSIPLSATNGHPLESQYITVNTT